jgi:hypothetical protein
MLEAWAWEAANASPMSAAPNWPGSPSQRAMVAPAALLYRAIGRRPLTLKLASALAGAAAVASIWVLAASLFGPGPAAWTAWGAALWPSAAFLGSQWQKDPLIITLITGFFAVSLTGTPGPRRALAGAVLLTAAAALRSHLLIASLAAAAGAAMAARGDSPRSRWLAVACLTALAAYGFGASRFFSKVLPPPARVSADDPTRRVELLPTYHATGAGARVPLTPSAFAAFRRYRQSTDQAWSVQQTGRRIQTQIYPDAEIDGWMDVALFLPKSAMTALFQPLPGLYPLAGSPMRAAAAAENLILVALFVLATAGALRAPPTPERGALLAFAATLAGGMAVFEFDLGSAARHKLLVFILLAPFAFEEALRRRELRRSA